MCDVCFFFDFQTSKNVWESCWKCAISCVHFTKKKIYQDKIRTTELKLRRTTKVSNRSWTGEKEKAWVEESVKKFCLVTLSLFLLALDYVVYHEHVSALPAWATVAPVSHQRHLQCFELTATPTSTAPLIHHYSSIHTVNVHSGSTHLLCSVLTSLINVCLCPLRTCCYPSPEFRADSGSPASSFRGSGCRVSG